MEEKNKPRQKSLPKSGKGKILLMDDDELIRETAGEMLHRLGYDVGFAWNGSEAIKVYKTAMESGSPFDAVIMDLTIPGRMGGKEAIKGLLEIDPDVKAIVSSGYSSDTIMANYKQFGFAGVLAKPYRSKELSELLYQVISKKTG